MPRETEHGKHANIRPLKLLRDSVLVFSVNVPGTKSKDVMDVVLVTQYLDTMKEVGALSSHTNRGCERHCFTDQRWAHSSKYHSELVTIPAYMLHEWHVAYQLMGLAYCMSCVVFHLYGYNTPFGGFLNSRPRARDDL